MSQDSWLMCNKVLIVEKSLKDKEEWESILKSIVDDGGEIFFAEKKEDALFLIEKEKPQLAFVEACFIDNEEAWLFEGVHIVLIEDKKSHSETSEDYILKPLRRHQVLQKCQEILSHDPAFPLPPM